jgi:peptidoglycan/LPS O-acetylase OafA/YrhL
MNSNLAAMEASAVPELALRDVAVSLTGGSASDARLHLSYIDGFRAIAALYVVWSHLAARAWGSHRPTSLALRLLAKLSNHGHFAVTAFIVISGFCLMLPVSRSGMQLRGGSLLFFKRRFWRIAPPMYAAFLLSAAILQLGRIHLVYGYGQVTLTQILAHAFLVQVPVPGGLLGNNGALWSISVECFMYLFFPAIVIFSRRIGTAITAFFCVAAGYILLFSLRGTIPGVIAWQYLGAFALGVLAAITSYSETKISTLFRDRVPWYGIAAVSFGGVAALAIIKGWDWAVGYTDFLDFPVAVAAASILIGASRQGRNPVRDLLQVRALAFIGLFSYSLYLIHYPLEDLFYAYVIIPLRTGEVGCELLNIAVVVPVILVASYLFYIGFERPFHRLARRIGKQ